MIFLAKLKIALPASLPSSAARLSLLVALYLAPLGFDPVSSTLAFRSNTAYASENTKPDYGPNNTFSDSSNSEQGSAMDAMPDNNSNNGSNNGPANSSDSGSSNNLNNGPDGGSADGLGDDNASGSHPDNNNGENSENHQGALRPANLTEFLSSLRNGSRIVNAQRTGHNIEIQYSDGWQEQIKDGVYTLAGPNDNVVIQRPATKRDYQRLNSAF